MLSDDVKQELNKPLSGVSSCTALQKVTTDCVQLTSKDVQHVREALKPKVCPVCFKPSDRWTLDHCHKTGLVRKVLCAHCNAFLGRIENNSARHLVKNTVLPTVLRNFANLLEQEHYRLIHPSEKPKEEKFSKSLFNKIAKWYTLKYPNRKRLVYPKSGKLTKALADTYEKYLTEVEVQ